MCIHHKKSGFTLLEILIALFIFSIVSLILAGALRTVINAQSGTAKNAERLRQTQVALMMFSRDVEQALNRPILNSAGKEEPAFMGDKNSVSFTHTGAANPEGTALRSSLSRSGYVWHDNALYRVTWNALDLPPDAKPHERKLLEGVSELTFQYLDGEHHFQNDWPSSSGKSADPLPRAVKMELTISHWGKMSQLYVIPAEPKNVLAVPQKR